MTKGRKATIKGKDLENRKYKVCAKCGLNIRCGDVEAHEKGIHHNGINKNYRR